MAAEKAELWNRWKRVGALRRLGEHLANLHRLLITSWSRTGGSKPQQRRLTHVLHRSVETAAESSPSARCFTGRLNVRFSNRALMSSSQFLWHGIGRVLAWVKLLFAVGTGGIQPLQASVGRCGEPGFWTCFYAQQTDTASSRPRPRRDAPFEVGVSGYFMTLLPPYPSGTGCHRATCGGG